MAIIEKWPFLDVHLLSTLGQVVYNFQTPSSMQQKCCTLLSWLQKTINSVINCYQRFSNVTFPRKNSGTNHFLILYRRNHAKPENIHCYAYNNYCYLRQLRRIYSLINAIIYYEGLTDVALNLDRVVQQQDCMQPYCCTS